jgi:hypothetical protein
MNSFLDLAVIGTAEWFLILAVPLVFGAVPMLVYALLLRQRSGSSAPSDVRRLEEENASLKRIVSDLSLEKRSLEEALGKRS